MNTINGEKSPRGLSSTTWLLIFCIFNLLLTLALFASSMKRGWGEGFIGNAMMNRGGRDMMWGNDTYRNIKRPMMQQRERSENNYPTMMSGANTMMSGGSMMTGKVR